MGDILVILTVRPSRSRNPNQLILETEVIDTGIGISPERQKMLFVPFLELKMKQNLKAVKDNSIGMGLAFSKIIVNSLGGEI